MFSEVSRGESGGRVKEEAWAWEVKRRQTALVMLLPEAFQRPTVSLFVVLASFPSALLNCLAYKPHASKP